MPVIKVIVGITALLIFIFNFSLAKAATSPETKIVLASGQQSICGFKFAPVGNLVVVRRLMRKENLRNRVDNERHDACPYNIELKYKGISVRLDFSRDVTLQRLRDVDNDESVITAFFR